LFNATWFLDGNPMPLPDYFFPGGKEAWPEKLMIHIDHASPQPVQITQIFFTDNGLHKLAHLPYSPDNRQQTSICVRGKE
jgi:hypothetical protein